jgi:hypothetical protein
MFPVFFGLVGSESKGEMVWPASVWNIFWKRYLLLFGVLFQNPGMDGGYAV